MLVQEYVGEQSHETGLRKGRWASLASQRGSFGTVGCEYLAGGFMLTLLRAPDTFLTQIFTFAGCTASG